MIHKLNFLQCGATTTKETQKINFKSAKIDLNFYSLKAVIHLIKIATIESVLTTLLVLQLQNCISNQP